MLAVGVFLIFLLVAVQVLVHLFATSVVEAAAYDAAREVSGASGADPEAAEHRARAQLGPLSERATFRWSLTEDEVGLDVRVERSTVVPAPFAERLGFDIIERGFVMRVEAFR